MPVLVKKVIESIKVGFDCTLGVVNVLYSNQLFLNWEDKKKNDKKELLDMNSLT